MAKFPALRDGLIPKSARRFAESVAGVKSPEAVISSRRSEPNTKPITAGDLPPEFRQTFIDAVEKHPYIRALRETRADGEITRIAAHFVLDQALDEMRIPRDHSPEAAHQAGSIVVEVARNN